MKTALVIFVAIVAVLLYMYMRKKSREATLDSLVEPAKTQIKSPEPQVQPEPLIEASEVAETIVTEEVVVKEPKPNVAEVVEGSSRVSSIPEDAALKRHFIQQLTAEIEATMPARPTDSTLKRHYDAQLSSSVACKLDALK